MDKVLIKKLAMYTDTPAHVDNILALIKEAGYLSPLECESISEFVLKKHGWLSPAQVEEKVREERIRFGKKLREWLCSQISDTELAEVFEVSNYDWRILFNEKQATFNSWCGSLVEECDYPLCKAKQALRSEIGG